MTLHLKCNSKKNVDIIKPLLKAGVLYFGLLIFAGCSSFIVPLRSAPKDTDLSEGYQEMSTKDYEEHLASLRDVFYQNPRLKITKLNRSSQAYLESLVQEILTNNEIFFKKLKYASITVIDTEIPLHFSLPKGSIFLSKGLITKYLKNESLLICLLSFELVKSEKLLYVKQTFVPTGHVSLERMLSINRLNLDEKMEVHKWAYHLTVRNGYEGESYLAWLQAQNRNTADFVIQAGDINQITREEALFKAFLIQDASDDVVQNRRSTTKNYYKFLNELRES